MEINYLAVLVAGLAMFVLGGLWYSPVLFGTYWMKLMKYTDADMEKAKNDGSMPWRYAGGLGTSLVTAWVFSYVFAFALLWFGNRIGSANALMVGLQTGFWLWLGFAATKNFGGVLWEGKSLKLWVLNSGHDLTAYLVLGVVFGLWA